MATKIADKKGTNISVSFFVPDAFLDDILAGCFEGGSNYWIGKKIRPKGNNYMGAEFASEVVSRDGILIITEDCNEVGCEVKDHELTKDRLLKGIIMYAATNGSMDFDDMDAGDYDMILQYALFGSQKYS